MMESRKHPIAGRAAAVILSTLVATEAAAQLPPPGDEPPLSANPAAAPCTRRGRLHRMFHHTAHTIQDDFIGYPPTFYEPPLGSYVNRQFAVQVSKADVHRFTVYQTDFLPGTDLFSPVGASRFNRMFGRLPAWDGPILVEWTPDQPGLAEARRKTILATLASAGTAVPPERVVIAPSPYPGALGVESSNFYNNMVGRTGAGTQGYPLPPTFSSSMGVR